LQLLLLGVWISVAVPSQATPGSVATSQAPATSRVHAPAYAPAPASVPLVEFLRSAYLKNESAAEARLGPRYRALCKSLSVPDTLEANRKALLPLLFLHGLLTTSDAVDCRRGGAFGTAYMWHWVSPNPRHALRRLPDSTLLTGLPPPPGFGKYKSWADVDRLPSLYLGDLATEHARYLHPVCGELQAFGWCSEREMAFGALLAVQGIKGKIKQEGIHVWTEVLFDLIGSDGNPRPSVVAFDNTFDSVEAWLLRGSRTAWAKDFGDGTQVGWYNRVAGSAAERDKVKAIPIGPEAGRRMTFQIQAWLGKGR
jgi:hypothetical protein